mmetsp:Transcript_1214/g.2800  ORF Transcript_1214/g.2800 Transcript_1214/m.2800 type:complete len:288 (+) Transcript_1214:1093-1956(+)
MGQPPDAGQPLGLELKWLAGQPIDGVPPVSLAQPRGVVPDVPPAPSLPLAHESLVLTTDFLLTDVMLEAHQVPLHRIGGTGEGLRIEAAPPPSVGVPLPRGPIRQLQHGELVVFHVRLQCDRPLPLLVPHAERPVAVATLGPPRIPEEVPVRLLVRVSQLQPELVPPPPRLARDLAELVRREHPEPPHLLQQPHRPRVTRSDAGVLQHGVRKQVREATAAAAPFALFFLRLLPAPLRCAVGVGWGHRELLDEIRPPPRLARPDFTPGEHLLRLLGLHLVLQELEGIL